jgi:hypothetical protein
MKKYLSLPLLAIACLLSLSAFIADDPFTELLKKLDEFTKKHPQEKVYLHLDKPYYAIGDNIWFKAYVVDGQTSLPSNMSNILYVELINERDSISKQIKLPMQSGTTWGDFKLSDSLSEGNYRIRAYTQWMRNAGPDFFFDKTIKIGNGWTNKVFTQADFQYGTENGQEHVKANIKFTNNFSAPLSKTEVIYQVVLGNKKTTHAKTITNVDGTVNINIVNTSSNNVKKGYIIANLTLANGQKVSKQIPIKTTLNTIDVQFFPEGGNLVEGLPCKVGVKAIASNGLGENLSGTITDNDGLEVLAFETTYLGMGAFSLTPMPGKTYTAKIKFKNGTSQTFSLPKPRASGYILSVNNLDSAKISIKVMLSPDLLNKGDLNLLAQHQGNVLFAGKVSSARQVASAVVPKSDFPSGIVQITLFDSQNVPVCERLAFVNNAIDKIDLDFQNIKSSYTKKSLVDFSIIATNNNKPLQGSFSVSITNTSVVAPAPEDESNILTRLLLTADLKGYVEKPNHYFLKNDLATKIQLDQLLLTQGWRQIDWSAISSSVSIVNKFPAEKSIKISGVVTNKGKPVVNGKVSLISSSRGIFATDTVTDANGRFIFDKIVFNDNTKFAIKSLSGKDNNGIKITMDDLPTQLVTVSKNIGDIDVNVNESLKSYLKQSADYFNEQESRGFLNRVNQLSSVEIVAGVNKAAPNSSNLNGSGVADAVFNANDFKNSQSLSQFLQSNAMGVRIDKGKVFSSRDTGLMTIYVDGMRYIDSQGDAEGWEIDDIALEDVQSVEVLRTTALTSIYGQSGENGILIITTKTGRGGNKSQWTAPGILAYTPKGFYEVRQFYSPKYDVNPSPQPDYRPTVFWEPHLVTDVNGKANIKFYNTDQTGTVRMIIEGFDGEGNLARKVITYTVN